MTEDSGEVCRFRFKLSLAQVVANHVIIRCCKVNTIVAEMGDERALSDRFFSQNILQIVQNIWKDTSQRIKEHTLIRQSGERSQAGSTGWWLGVR